jgi:sphingosine kinase
VQSSRSAMLKAIDGAPQGAPYWLPMQHYYKALAYRVTPAPDAKGWVSVDGEAYPFEPFHVEVHKGLATVLSLENGFVDEFKVGPGGKKIA